MSDNTNGNGGPLPEGVVISEKDAGLSFTATPDDESPISISNYSRGLGNIAPDSTLSIMVTPSKQYKWKPKSDITAHELAMLMPVLLWSPIGGYALETMIADLPENAKRHLEEVH